MEKQEAIAAIQRAAEEERLAVLQCIERYEALTAKMRCYQSGEGLAPTMEEFDQWREDVETFIAIKLLKAGIG